MPRTYELDSAAAKDANNGGKRISEPGAYSGTFRAAWYEQNEKGTESVHLIFVSDAGQEAGPLALYTHRGNGEALPSYKMLNAIMACMKQRKLSVKRGKVKLWDSTAGEEVEKEKDTYPELIGPKIGLVLQGEEYEARDGKIKQRLLIAAPYEAASRKMADEVLTSATEAHALDRYLAWFEKGHQVRPLKGERQSSGSTSHPPGAASEFVDDDIPF